VALVIWATSLGLVSGQARPASAGQARRASALLKISLGYELVGADGGVFTVGAAQFAGSLGGRHIAHKIVAVLGSYANQRPLGSGYLLIDSAGIVYPFGLESRGDLRGVHLRSPIVAAITAPGLRYPNTGGYLMVAADGGVFAFGTAPFPGSLAGFKLPAPIVGIEREVLHVGGDGFWLVDAAGHVYPLGDAKHFGDLGSTRLSAPVVGMVEDGHGFGQTDGYLLATADGKIFPFGTATWRGDASHLHLRAPIVGIAPGYYLFAADGGVFAFGGAPFLGSMVGRPLREPITAMGFQSIPQKPPPCGTSTCPQSVSQATSSNAP
jgi:hypothetical protein